MNWTTLIVAIITGTFGGGGALLFKTRADNRKTDADTGLTNTQAAAQLTTSSMDLVRLLEETVTATAARAKQADDRAEDLQKKLTSMERQVDTMQKKLSSMSAELEAYRAKFGPIAI